MRFPLLREFVNHASDPPEAIKREEVGEDRLHCSFPTQPKEGHIRHDTKHGTNTIVSVHASQLIPAEIYQPLPLSRTIPNTPMKVLLDPRTRSCRFPHSSWATGTASPRRATRSPTVARWWLASSIPKTCYQVGREARQQHATPASWTSSRCAIGRVRACHRPPSRSSGGWTTRWR